MIYWGEEEKMGKPYEEQLADIRAKEIKKAKSLGFENVEAYRKHQANENRKKTYLAKIERYEKQLAEIKKWLADYENGAV